MARSLATIRRVAEVLPIAGADKVGIAHMAGLGWDVVVAKLDIHEGDMVVFFEIDSALSAKDKRYQFLKDTKQSTLGPVYVLRTKKLRGVVSQGLAMPIALFPLCTNKRLGDDVTKLLAVNKWDDIKPAATLRKASAADSYVQLLEIPGFFPITDQLRIEANTSLFELHAATLFTVLIKADGSSMSVFYVDLRIDPRQYGVCSHRRRVSIRKPSLRRNLKRVEAVHGIWRKVKAYASQIYKWWKEVTYKGPTSNLFLAFANLHELLTRLKKVYCLTGRNLVFQGLLVGPGMNGNRDRYTNRHFLLFDIYDVDNKQYMLPKLRALFYRRYLQLFMETVTTKTPAYRVLMMHPNVALIQKYATFISPRGYKALGIVCKSNSRPYVHFKCVSRLYLLKNKED